MPIDRGALSKGYQDTSHCTLPKGYRYTSGGALPKETNIQSEENKIRKGWTELEKEDVRIRQHGVCNKCGRPPPRWEYHHRNGNRSDNNLSNCEGLCPNCHSVKTHG